MKKLRPRIQADCSRCKYQIFDERWKCLVCKLGEKMPGIKFKRDETGYFWFCHGFELKKGK